MNDLAIEDKGIPTLTIGVSRLIASVGLALPLVMLGFAWHMNADVHPAVIYVKLLLFVVLGAIAVLAGWCLFSGSIYVRVSPEGLTFRNLWQSHSYSWSEMSAFDVIDGGGGIANVQFVALPARPEGAEGDLAARLRAGETGFRFLTIPHFMALRPAQLARLLNDCREFALRRDGLAPATRHAAGH